MYPIFFALFFLIFTHRPWYQVNHCSPCLSHCLEQIPWVCPRDPAKSFPKLNNSSPPRGEKKYQNCTTGPWVLVGSAEVSRGATHGKANDKCINPRGMFGRTQEKAFKSLVICKLFKFLSSIPSGFIMLVNSENSGNCFHKQL